MTPEQQRIAIAEAAGWVADVVDKGIWYIPNTFVSKQLPDYLNDLNAMHEAEKVLSEDQLNKMVQLLYRIPNPYRFWRASASQRAEAFLRTIGKWTE